MRVKDHGNLGMTSFTQVVFSILFSIFLKHEYPSFLKMIGMAVVVYGIVKTMEKQPEKKVEVRIEEKEELEDK